MDTATVTAEVPNLTRHNCPPTPSGHKRQDSTDEAAADRFRWETRPL